MFARARLRLTLLYIVLFALVLGLFSVIFYVVMTITLQPDFDLAPELSSLQAAELAYRTTVERIGGADEDEIIVHLAPADRRSVGAVLEAWLKPRARAAIEREIRRHAPALSVAPTAVSVRDQRTRWGSASRQGRLAFSWRLVLAPPEALETVVIHELAHLRIFGHGPRFWSIVAGRRPDHKVWRRWLRDHSADLHGALDETLP